MKFYSYNEVSFLFNHISWRFIMKFQAPVGTEEERNSGQIWPGDWLDANKWVGTNPPKYQLGPGNWAYHTGADLNRPGDKDKLAPIFSIGDGVVRYARLVTKGTWGNLIVINHGIVDGKPLFSRYAHVEEIQPHVIEGQPIKMGTYLAKVGNQFGVFPYHLHFDISTTDKLNHVPTYWPGLDLSGCKQHFVNPKDWLSSNHIVGSLPDVSSEIIPSDNKPDRTNVIPISPTWYVIVSEIAIYKNPNSTSEKLGTLTRGEGISIGNEGVKNENLIWGRISGGNFNGTWIAIQKADQTESYLSTNQIQSLGNVTDKPNKNLQTQPTSTTWYVTISQAFIHKAPNNSSEKTGMLSRGKQVILGNEGARNQNMDWGRVVGGTFDGDWIAIRKSDQSESYLSTNRPQ